jgi:hypothetical protein
MTITDTTTTWLFTAVLTAAVIAFSRAYDNDPPAIPSGVFIFGACVIAWMFGRRQSPQRAPRWMTRRDGRLFRRALSAVRRRCRHRLGRVRGRHGRPQVILIHDWSSWLGFASDVPPTTAGQRYQVQATPKCVPRTEREGRMPTKQGAVAKDARHGEMMIEVRVRFWTDEIAGGPGAVKLMSPLHDLVLNAFRRH